MKTINRILTISAISIVALGGTTSCNKYLDIAPGSIITPDNYFNSEEELGAYAINMYTNGSIPNPSTNNNEFMVNDWGLGGSDAQTDNQMNIIVPERMIDKGYSVPSSDKKWDFGKIYNANFFFDAVLPKYEAGKIKGNKDLIKHYIGEMYFFRAAAYFEHLKRYGDFPIVKTLLKNDMNILVEASKRSPRNEVARFILEDLDKAIDMMKAVAPDGKRNRLFKDVAILYKARVALYEGTFLKNFKGTPFVPKGAGWPGESKAFGSYAYPTGNIDAEIGYFLDVAMKESKIIADKYSLTENTYKRIDKPGISNPYYLMFADDDLSKYPEVLMWRQYNSGLSKNIVSQYASKSNGGIGVSRSLVQAFVDKDGKPWYAAGSKCEDLGDIMKLVDNRDSRALLFLKVPGQINIVTNADKINNGAEYEPKVPNISSSVVVDMYLTGYTLRKYLSPDGNHCNSTGYASAPSFRASEAYLT
ncbi:MAG: RagB/SusD family nutrient uptake outer membrane protein, partial [Rikenellaceae bacterium]